MPGATGAPGAPGPAGPPGIPADTSLIGSVYTRWGRTSCDGDAVLLYQGER